MVPLAGVTYSLLVGDAALGLLGDVKTVTTSARASGQVNSAKYPFSIIYNNRHCLVQKDWLHRVQGFWFLSC